MNLDVAGEFLVMAATLIHIKSRTLLPRPDPTQDDTDPEEDPREALVRRLLEHEKYKAAADMLHDRETLRRRAVRPPGCQCGRRRRRGVRARARSGPLQPPGRIPWRTRACESSPAHGPAAGSDLDRRSHPTAPRAVVRDGSLRIRGSVHGRRRVTRLHDRDVSRAAGDDPAEIDSSIPGRELRGDSSVQTCAARGCAAADRGSAESVTAGPPAVAKLWRVRSAAPAL